MSSKEKRLAELEAAYKAKDEVDDYLDDLRNQKIKGKLKARLVKRFEFRCYWCGRKYANKSNLNKHLKKNPRNAECNTPRVHGLTSGMMRFGGKDNIPPKAGA